MKSDAPARQPHLPPAAQGRPPHESLRAADLETEAIAKSGLLALDQTSDRDERTHIIAGTVVAVFDHYYWRSRRIPHMAQRAFEARNWPEMAQLSRDRLAIYSMSLESFVPVLRAAWPMVPDPRGFWVEVEAKVLQAIRGRYEADLAFAYLRSLRRAVAAAEWTPVAYAGSGIRANAPPAQDEICRTLQAELPLSVDTVLQILELVPFKTPFRDLPGDASLTARAINAHVSAHGAATVTMIDAGFFRNRGAYLIGRIDWPSSASPSGMCPLGIALLNEPGGLAVDAVLLLSDDLQFVFSSSLANFHVTSERYHALAYFLAELMPKRPLGLHYSTIGFNHVGKFAVMAELKAERVERGGTFDFAVGSRGTVAIGFSLPHSRYVLKVVRDRPTAGYKWGAFPGVATVLEKYRVVHESDRAGSMLDNVIYDNVRLEAAWFEGGLLEELTSASPSSVSVEAGFVTFGHLIVQMKMVPIPEYLKAETPENAEAAVLNLGNCIRNNAAANIFNRDLDARNYGVSPIGKVYLFDYDAVEPLTEVKIRTNTGREEGEEDTPDWVFETGTVFLPEEMLPGLRIDDPHLRRLFRQANADLLGVEYWEGMQRALQAGLVPKVRAYPVSKRLRRPAR